MKNLIIILICPLILSGSALQRSFTINHSNVFGGPLTNYPILFSGTYTYLKTVGNGGSVISNNGYDIYFTSGPTPSLSNLLPFERVAWGASTGIVSFWVQVPSVSSSSDTVIYLNYGDSGVTHDLQNRTGVWDSNFVGVWHFGDGITLDTTDSTSNHNDGTVHNGSGSVTAIQNPFTNTAPVVNGVNITPNGSGAYISVPASSSLNITGAITIQGWAWAAEANVGIVGKGEPGSNGYDWRTDGSNNMLFVMSNGGVQQTRTRGAGSGNPYEMYLTYDGTNTVSLYSYIPCTSTNFTDSASWGANAIGNNSSVPLAIGAFEDGSSTWGGHLAEVRISKSTRTAGWLQTDGAQVDNCNGTHYTLGSQTSTSGITTVTTQIGAFLAGP